MFRLKHINRLRQIIQLLLLYGFNEIVDNSLLRKIIPAKNRYARAKTQDLDFSHLSRWERIRLLVEELGPTFVKFAQVLSNRPDILPSPLLLEFQKLQDDVLPFEFEKVEQIIESETGLRLIQIFEFLDEKPLGSASIGQVHQGKLRTGESVVIKVQRPNIQSKISTDLSLIKELIRLTENYFARLGLINPVELFEEFEQKIQKELDYNYEARNLILFKKTYKNEANLNIPAVFEAFSTEQLLMMEHVNACKINNLEQLLSWNLKPLKIAENGLKIYLNQIFKQGLFHADPHPGNVLVSQDGTINLIDFGMIGRLTKKDKFAFAGILVGIANQNARAVARNLYRLAIDHEINDMRKFEFDINKMLEEIGSLDSRTIEIFDVAQSLQQLIYKYRIQVSSSILLIIRTIVVLEGIKKIIAPKLDIFEFIKPYGLSLFKEQFGLKQLIPRLLNSSSEFNELFLSLPYETENFLRKLREGKLNFQIEQKDFQLYARSMNRTGNKIAIALLIVGLLIFAALAAQLNPIYNGLSFFSWMALFLSVFWSFVLLFLLFRK